MGRPGRGRDDARRRLIRLTVFIGDVVGKGSAASIVMTAAQSYLEARLHLDEPLTDVVADLNRFVADRTLGAEFLTLWIGRIGGGRIEYVDAGHGYAYAADGTGVRRLNGAGGIPVGIDAASAYRSATEEFTGGAALVLCSDGAIEQRNGAREEFSSARLEAMLAQSGHSIAAESLLSAVRAFAGREGLDDDFTACIVRAAASEQES